MLFSHYFHSKEPDPEPVIKQFAEGYGVQFDMFSKINVNGSNALSLYKYLKSQQKGTLGRQVYCSCYLINDIFPEAHSKLFFLTGEACETGPEKLHSDDEVLCTYSDLCSFSD